VPIWISWIGLAHRGVLGLSRFPVGEKMTEQQ
jgi:hypothetical protein